MFNIAFAEAVESAITVVDNIPNTLAIIKEIGIIVVPIILAIIGVVNLWMTKGVHTIVNSAMTQEKTENALLKGLLVSKQLELDTMEKARIALATATANTGTVAAVVAESKTVTPVNVVDFKEPVPKVVVP